MSSFLYHSGGARSGAAVLDHIPLPSLIGDIGGTNARFALVHEAESLRFADEQTADYKTIDDAIEHALSGRRSRPQSAVLALAGPIVGDAVPLTNCEWVVEPRRLIARFGLSEVILLNDFEAQSLSLPGLGPADVDLIGGGVVRSDWTRVVVGPGTGLGAGALVHARGTWVPVPGEGGHIDLGPVSKRDLEIWPHLERVEGRISAEALLSGGGLLRLYRGIAKAGGKPAPLATPSDVTSAGLSGSSAEAREALELFATYLGRFAGDLALVFMAYGGVYLAGGIPTRIASVMKSGGFREAFVAKEPHREIMEKMATGMIIKKDAALAGIADFVRKPAQFGVELSGRRWEG